MLRALRRARRADAARLEAGSPLRDHSMQGEDSCPPIVETLRALAGASVMVNHDRLMIYKVCQMRARY